MGSEPFDTGACGVPLKIDGKYLCTTLVVPSGQGCVYKYGDTGRPSYVDDHGRLLITLDPSDVLTYKRDIITPQINGIINVFILSHEPHANTVKVILNGLILDPTNNEYSITDDILTMTYTPYKDNSLIVEYFYQPS
jgi:hypothetical protein